MMGTNGLWSPVQLEYPHVPGSAEKWPKTSACGLREKFPKFLDSSYYLVILLIRVSLSVMLPEDIHAFFC